jgi:hypothetical protein
MFGHKIKLDSDLYEKLKKCADAAGYSSAAEFALHVLERETGRILGPGERRRFGVGRGIEKETGGLGLHRVRALCLNHAAPGRNHDRFPRIPDPAV